jgi:hypothetical protein
MSEQAMQLVIEAHLQTFPGTERCGLRAESAELNAEAR